MSPWVPPAPIVERIDDARLPGAHPRVVYVVRDDLVVGGSKSRFLPFLLDGAKEVVYGGPFCGGAPVALAACAKMMGLRATIFYANRQPGNMHERQKQVLRYGAKILWVPMGFMSHVQAEASAYAKEKGARYLPLGFDVPEAEPPFLEAMHVARKALGFAPDEVWCATSTGMLARCLGKAFVDSAIKAVTVGAKSYHEKQVFTPNVELVPTRYKYEQACVGQPAPFPICPHYEAKAWELMWKSGSGRVLFWNVIGR